MKVSGKISRPFAKPKLSGIVFSDTHFGAPYSERRADGNFPAAEDVLVKELAKPDTDFCVMNGDIYEGLNIPVKDLLKTERESKELRAKLIAEATRKSGTSPEELDSITQDHIQMVTKTQEQVLSEMLGRQMTHLESLIKMSGNPHCKFYYVIGNHERLPEYIHNFKELAKSLNKELGEERLVVTEEYVKLGDGLFIHGDQQIDPKTYSSHGTDKFKSSYEELHRPKIGQFFHDFFNKVIPYAVGQRLFHSEQCARSILEWLREKAPEELWGVTNIFSGHTHFPYTNMRIIDGVAPDLMRHTYHPEAGDKGEGLAQSQEFFFHNTGANITRFSRINRDVFNPLRITFTADPNRKADLQNAHTVPEFAKYKVQSVEQIMPPQQAAAFTR